jgi:hypothetical protein
LLVELGVVEQRYQAVLEVLGGATVIDVARRYGVARHATEGQRPIPDDRGLLPLFGPVQTEKRPTAKSHRPSISRNAGAYLPGHSASPISSLP